MDALLINSGDTAWVLVSTALVLLMTPALAFFYGGMVRSKGVLNMMMMSFVSIGVVTTLWVIYGFELAFGYQTDSKWFGNFSLFKTQISVSDLTNNGGVYPIPLMAFAAFQLGFAIITPALISGAIADRTKFSAWAVFVGLWSTLVYFPVAHWVFAFGQKVGDKTLGTGLLAGIGLEDFAGGTAVHINAGAAGLAMAIVVGKRIGWQKDPMKPHSVPMVLFGAGLLWFGWFGFNAGSALAANGVAAIVLFNTQVAGAAGILGWLIIERIRGEQLSSTGAASGAVSGLVAITPACAFVSQSSSLLIGLIAGILCALASGLRYKVGVDDSLDVASLHLVGGVWGSLAIGFFGSSAVNSLGVNGLFHGGGLTLLTKQAFGVIFVAGYSFAVTLIIAIVIEKTIGFRVSAESEIEGVDIGEHGEIGYQLINTSTLAPSCLNH